MLPVWLALKLTSSNKGHGNLWLSEPLTCRVTLRYCGLVDCMARCVNTCKSTCDYFVFVNVQGYSYRTYASKLVVPV